MVNDIFDATLRITTSTEQSLELIAICTYDEDGLEYRGQVETVYIVGEDCL